MARRLTTLTHGVRRSDGGGPLRLSHRLGARRCDRAVAVKGRVAPAGNRCRGCSRDLWCGKPAGHENFLATNSVNHEAPDIDQLRVEARGSHRHHALVQSMLKVDAMRTCGGLVDLPFSRVRCRCGEVAAVLHNRIAEN